MIGGPRAACSPSRLTSIMRRTRGGELRFRVRDTGCGVPRDALEYVFERFRQVRGDRRGLGLGLHIAKGIVEAHGGRLWAESTPNRGSTFHFTCPGPSSSAPGAAPGSPPP